MQLDSKIPDGPIEQKWDRAIFQNKLINPANKRKYRVIVVGSGLAGASAAATLAELGYRVDCFCFQDTPRRAHSIAAQGGINAAKNYPNDGDSISPVHRLRQVMPRATPSTTTRSSISRRTNNFTVPALTWRESAE